MKGSVFSINRFCPDGGKLLFMSPTSFPRSRWLAALCGGVALLAFSGCEEGSISDSTPYGSAAYVGGRSREIDELELLGSRQGANESDIQNALRERRAGPACPLPGSKLLVVQSGAASPDSLMLGDLERVYRVFPASGLAPTDSRRDGTLGRDLRLEAARSGCQYVLCYWGRLESIREDGVTKAVSWVPVVGGLIPDEQRTTRLRVRAVLIDVASGRTSTYTPPVVQNSAVSAGFARDSARDKQTLDLKLRAYASLVAQMSGLPE